ncbi:MAG: hypothetical protein Q9169_005452 [Polycauliona sp. 2 TL-2023]
MKLFHCFRRETPDSPGIPTITETLPPSPERPQTQGVSEALEVSRHRTTRARLSTHVVRSIRGKDGSAERHDTAGRHANPLGLSVLYEPHEGVPVVDIIFVHGLGGTSQNTWSRNKDENLFWPRQWLPKEPGFEQARIISFGYDADFVSAGRNNILNITDFAKELLYGMAFGLDDYSRDFEVGRVPIIFVAHSMGGLVVKKAHILGETDNRYRQSVDATCAIVFLSTPHRGTDLAATLNRVLAVSVFTHSTKEYIAEMGQNSQALQDINEQFRHIAPRLSIFSFYETERTTIGPRKIMVLVKDSSILGYPDEVSTALNADHHNVCKYSSQQDPNYVRVRHALRYLVSKASNASLDAGFLRVDLVPASFLFLATRYNKLFTNLVGQRTTRIRPQLPVLFFQVALSLPELRDQLHKMSEEGVKLVKAEARIIWRKIFASKLFKLRVRQPLYWIVDALDECETPELLLDLFSSIVHSQVPLRILFVSRKTEALSASFQRICHSTPIDELSNDSVMEDLTRYLKREVGYMHCGPGIKAHIIQSVIEKADGVFLWVHLVLKEISRCNTEAEIKQALEEMPAELEPLYQRMELTLLASLRPGDQKAFRLILTWIACSKRPLTLGELSEALKPELSNILDLSSTIGHVCGEFAVIDAEDRVGMVHQTAREYLINTSCLDLESLCSGLDTAVGGGDSYQDPFKRIQELDFVSQKEV